MKDALIVIPAYNEEKNIAKVLKGIKNSYVDADIIVINDGSKDDTCRAAMEENVRVISNPFNLGYGGALQTGFKYAVNAGYKYVIQFDADGQHDPYYISAILDELEKDKYDIVIGSRFLSKSEYKTGFAKRIAIYIFKSIIRITTGKTITDPTSGFKGLSRRTFEYYSAMWNFPQDFPDTDILIHMIRSRYSICEVPANIRERVSGESMHSGLKPVVYIIKMMISITIVLLRNRFTRGIKNG